MSLFNGKKNIGKNIDELKAANKSKPSNKKRSKEQILAIALQTAYGKKKKGK